MDDSNRIYSDRHKRRLLKKQTEADIQRIFGSDNPVPSISNSNVRTAENIVDVNVDNIMLHRDDTADDSSYSLDFAARDNNRSMLHIEQDFDSDDDNNSSIHSYEYPCISSSSSDDGLELSDLELNDDNLFIRDITDWLREFRPSRNGDYELLRILRTHTKVKFPKDPRTLLNTPTSPKVAPLCQGEYWHSGLKNAIMNILNKQRHLELLCQSNNQINLFINIDGASLGKSTPMCLWPILCSDNLVKGVEVIGVYYGEGKPSNSTLFLDVFIKEAILLVNEGVTFDDTHYSVHIKGVICDAPAKAFVLNTLGHNAYSSCSKCCIHGKYIDHSVCFPGSCDTKRTDDKFKNNEYPDENNFDNK